MSRCPSANQPFTGTYVIRNLRQEIERAQLLILAEIERRDYDRACCFGIRLALEEALSNAFKHGNGDDPEKTVRLACSISDRKVVIDIEDQGQGFDPGSVPDPTQQENVEIPAGRGLVLMRSFMTVVRIHPPGNRVEMTYLRHPKTA